MIKKASKKSAISRRYPRQDRSKELFFAILEASAHIIEEQGISKLNTNLIAKKAGVSIGSLYQYFSNKDDILREVVQKRFKSDIQFIEEKLTNFTGDTLEEFLQYTITSYVELISSQLELRRSFFYIIHLLSLESIHRDLKLNLAKNVSRYLIENFPSQITKRNLQLRVQILLESVEINLYNSLLLFENKSKKRILIKELVFLSHNYLTH